MRLRIVAGSRGGRYIEAPPGRGTRPTSERVREAWFSAIGQAIVGARVADLFAGSGALGIEALSRGAEHVSFVESQRHVVGLIRRNLEALDLLERAEVISEPVSTWLDRQTGDFDVALADPPYAGEEAARLVERFRDRPFASQFWLEHPDRSEVHEGAEWTRAYGDTRVSCFCRTPEPDSTPRPATERR